MNLPWVGRTAYDLLLDERDRMRVQVDRLTEHVLRMERVERGLTEQPKEPRSQVVVPGRITKIAERFGSLHSQQSMIAGASRMYLEKRQYGRSENEAWNEVAGWLVEQLNVGEPV